MKKHSKVLGKGLQALIRENEIPDQGPQPFKVNINDIISNKDQPRKEMIGIKELADSIKEHGVIQPIVVSELGNGKYQIVAGERRWRAAKFAGLGKISVNIKTAISPKDNLVIGLIENLQREDLNPVEEAEAYQELINKFSVPVEYLSKVFGKDRTTITNTIRLLSLPSSIKDDLRKGLLQAGHARPLINIQDKKLISDIRNEIVKNKLSVRDVEKLIKNMRNNKKKEPGQKITKEKNKFLVDIEERFQEKLVTKVKINGDDNKGKIIIDYYSQDDLNRFLEILNII